MVLDFVHGQHGAGRRAYVNRLVRRLYDPNADFRFAPYDLSNVAIRNLKIGGESLDESYIAEKRVGEGLTIGVVSLGEIFSRFMKMYPTAGNWREVEPRVIDYVAQTCNGVDRLFVNHHSAALLNDEYVQGLEDKNVIRLWEMSGKDGITTVHFLISRPEYIEKGLMHGEPEKQYPFGIQRDLLEKYYHSRRIHSVIPDKTFVHVTSVLPRRPDFLGDDVEFMVNQKELPHHLRFL